MSSEQVSTICESITAYQHVKQYRPPISTQALSNSPFGKLPNELIFIILEYVGQGADWHEDMQCLLTCRHFMVLGSGHLRFGRYLNRSGFLSFTWRFPARFYESLSCLTIGLFYPTWTYPLPNDRKTLSIPLDLQWDPSVQFLHILPQLTNLLTFSLSIEAVEDYPASNRFLMGVLSRLPHSVIDLELDTGCSRRVPRGTTEFHLCEALGKILPRLHCLSLRTKWVCGALFGVDKPEDELRVCFPLLERLVIEIPDVHMPWPEPFSVDDTGCGAIYKTRRPYADMPNMLRMKRHGAFPFLHMCTFYFRKRMPQPKADGFSPVTHSFHMFANIVNETSLIIPYPTPAPHSGKRVLHAKAWDWTYFQLPSDLHRVPMFGFWMTLFNGMRMPDRLGLRHHHHHSKTRKVLDKIAPELVDWNHDVLYDPDATRRWQLLSSGSRAFRGVFDCNHERDFLEG
ncbi:hypothetical protein IWX50DRAFT_701749 [Phyllosticta citricarpa]